MFHCFAPASLQAFGGTNHGRNPIKFHSHSTENNKVDEDHTYFRFIVFPFYMIAHGKNVHIMYTRIQRINHGQALKY
jgi:hypothetical protein